MKLRVVALLAFLVVVAMLVVPATQRNGGDFTYPLDDSYIHLAVAKNLAGHGVWGITPEAFTPVSSSILWPLVLAGLGGAAPWAEFLPLVLNLILGLTILWFVDRRLRDFASVVRLGALAAVILIAPLGVLTFVGLEHVAQILLTLLLLEWAEQTLKDPEVSWRRGSVFAFLLVATRFEGAFLVAMIGLALLLRRRFRDLLYLGVAAALPVTLFGLVSVGLGGGFLPTPVWMKGRVASELLPAIAAGHSPGALLEFFVLVPLNSLLEVGVLGWLVGLLLMVVGLARREGRSATMAWIVLGTFWLHLSFARTGWLGRYEAWLVVMGLVTVAPLANRIALRLREPGPHRMGLLGLVLLVVAGASVPAGHRLAASWFQASRGSTNIYQQQVQMGRFLREFYPGRPVALNDIGAVNFLADLRCTDIWGLADPELARLRLAGALDRAALERRVAERGVELAVVYESLLDETGGAPRGWIPVADWRIYRNAVCASPRVTWYAADTAGARELRERLAAFELPSGVDLRMRRVE